MAFTLSPIPWHTYLDGNANPFAGAKLFTYASGTTNKVPVYQDSNGLIPHQNPMTLDSAGRPPGLGGLYLQVGVSYKFVLAPATDTDPPTSAIKSADPVSAVPSQTVELDVPGTAGEAIAANEECYLSNGTGGKTAGRWYKADANNSYSSSSAETTGFATAAIAAGSSGTFRLGGRLTGFVGLTPGAAYYVSTTPGAITNVAPTNVRFVGTADTSGSIIIGGQQLRRVLAVTTQTGNYTATIADDLIIGTGSWTLSVFTAVGNSGRELFLKNAGTGIITIDPNAAETVDGAALMPVFPGEFVRIVSDGANLRTSVSGARRIDRMTTPTTFTNNVTENTLYTFSVPGHTLGTNRVLHFRAYLQLATDAGGARNVNFRVKYGATTFVSGNVPYPAAETHYLVLDVYLYASGATNSQRLVATLMDASTAGGNTWSAISTTATRIGGNNTGAVDSTAAQNFVVTAQMDTAAVGFVTTMSDALLTVE